MWSQQDSKGAALRRPSSGPRRGGDFEPALRRYFGTDKRENRHDRSFRVEVVNAHEGRRLRVQYDRHRSVVDELDRHARSEDALLHGNATAGKQNSR